MSMLFLLMVVHPSIKSNLLSEVVSFGGMETEKFLKKVT